MDIKSTHSDLQPALALEVEDGKDDEAEGGPDDVEKGKRPVGEGEVDVHAVEAGDHGGDIEEDGQRGQQFNRFVQVVGEDDLVGVAQ